MFANWQQSVDTSARKSSGPLRSNPGMWPGIALLCALLTACGGGGGSVEAPQATADPLTAFTQQKLDWQACDPQRLGEGSAQELAMFTQRARCARMRVPVDYDHPGQGELQIELLRVAAAQPQRRLGAIVLNPGGPGADGLGAALISAAQWTQARPQSVGGAQLREMGNRYDLIGFSPRGLSASNPLICDVAGTFEMQDSLTFNRSAENLQHAQNNARVLGRACASNPLSAHIHTEATARDMDLIRAVLGEAQINYIGYSYGTWLGAWYARLFPERVGRMLFDSSINTQERLDDQLVQQEMGKQRILDEIMLPYAERHQHQLALGSAASLREALLALPPSLKEALFDRMDFMHSAQLEHTVLRMSAAIGLDTLVRDHPGAQGQALATLVRNHIFSPLPQTNAAVVPLALELIGAQEQDENLALQKNLVAVDAQGTLRLLPTLTVNLSVRCNDTGSQGDEQYWMDVSRDHVARYPMVGGRGVFKPCLHWSTPPRKMPPQPAGQGPQILMLQSRYDGTTPLEGAQATLAALPNARMIVVENDYVHGLFPYGTDCVDGQVAAYFLQGTLPARTSSCAGKPLGGDAGA